MSSAAQRIAARYVASAEIQFAGVGGHVLPPLPYAYDALEPYLSETTLRFHHDKHHAAYVKGLNEAERKLAQARASNDLEYAPYWTAKQAFNWGGHVLHTIYWHCMAPNGGGRPGRLLAELIDRDFGSFETFIEQYKTVTKAVEGSGWGVLVLTNSAVGMRLEIAAVKNHENKVLWDSEILLPLDVWEHAYYLDYANDRGGYLDVFFKHLVNWGYLEARLRRALVRRLSPKRATLMDRMKRQASEHLAKGRAKKDVGHGGLDEWFSGHGKGKSKSKGKARWGDWVAITPVKRTITREDGTKKTYEAGDIVGPCGISKTKEWKKFTRGGKDPLKCMPRQKAYDMPKAERAQLAKGKLKAERKEKETQAPTRTRTFKKKRATLCCEDCARKKTAKATGTKTGPSEWVGLFIPLPKELAKKFPDLGEEDNSPSHVTFLYIGEFKDKEKQGELLETLREIFRKHWPRVKATLNKLEYFDHPDKDRRVPHVSVKFDKDLSGFRHRVKQELQDAGIEVDDKFPEYKPHVTLAYMPGMDAEWEGKVPEGEWEFDEMEIWGLPELHKIPLGPQAKAVAASWVHRRFVAAVNHVFQKPGVKTAGWWAINGQKPPVDKGPLMNAIPGCDPADAAMYNGDGPADHTGNYLDQIDIMYRTVWGRPAHPEELQAVFNFCFRPIEDGTIKLNKWFDDFIVWFGTPATDITWSLEIWDKISWFFLQCRNGKYFPDTVLPDVWKTLDVVKDDLKRLNALEYASDTDTGSKFHDAVLAKLDTMRDYWMDTRFPKQLDDSERRLVKRISENWLKGCMR